MENVLVIVNANFEQVTGAIGSNDHDIIVVIVDSKGIIHRVVDVVHTMLPYAPQVPHLRGRAASF